MVQAACSSFVFHLYCFTKNVLTKVYDNHNNNTFGVGNPLYYTELAILADTHHLY